MKKTIALFMLALIGCSNPEDYQSKTIDNVTHVFFMGQSYTVFSENNETKELIKHEFGNCCKTKIFTDCPDDKNMWAEVIPDPPGSSWRIVKIHIHKSTEIGGGKTSGKYPQSVVPVK